MSLLTRVAWSINFGVELPFGNKNVVTFVLLFSAPVFACRLRMDIDLRSRRRNVDIVYEGMAGILSAFGSRIVEAILPEWLLSWRMRKLLAFFHKARHHQ